MLSRLAGLGPSHSLGLEAGPYLPSRITWTLYSCQCGKRTQSLSPELE